MNIALTHNKTTRTHWFSNMNIDPPLLITLPKKVNFIFNILSAKQLLEIK